VVFRPIHYACTKGAKPRARSGIQPTNDAGRMGKVRGDKSRQKPMDGWDPVYAARSEKAVNEVTQQEKIDSGLVRPYSKTSDRMIIEDIEKGYTVKKIAQIYNRDVDDLKKHIGKIKGKIKSHRCKGQDDNFKYLYAAIFKQAAREDIATVKGMIYAELHNRGISKKEIYKFIDEYKDEIEECVNISVFEEAKQYPETIKSEAIRNLSKIRNEFIKKYWR
jgi:hypothetical protein